MEKVKCFVAVIVLLLPLAGCAKQQPVETGMAPDEIASAIMESQSELPTLKQIDSGRKDSRRGNLLCGWRRSKRGCRIGAEGRKR